MILSVFCSRACVLFIEVFPVPRPIIDAQQIFVARRKEPYSVRVLFSLLAPWRLSFGKAELYLGLSLLCLQVQDLLEELQRVKLSESYRKVSSLPGPNDSVSFMVPLILVIITIIITVVVIVVLKLPFLRYLIYTKFSNKGFFFF